MKLILIIKALAGTPVTVPSSAILPKECGAILYPRVSMHAMRLSVHSTYTVQYTVQVISTNYTHYSSYKSLMSKIKMLMKLALALTWVNWKAAHMITQESFACQNDHYKLCENANSSAFTLLQSNNPLLIKNLNKFRKLAGGGGGCPSAPPLATALLRISKYSK